MRRHATVTEGLVAELPRLGLAMAGLVAALAFEHYFVHRYIVLPALSVGDAAPWMWGSLVIPELMVGFAAGWRLRSRASVVMYAGTAAVVREAFQLALHGLGEPGHVGTGLTPTEIAIATPIVAAAYLVVLGLASTSAQEEDRVVRGERGPDEVS